MQRLKNRAVVALTVIGLFAFSGLALAATEEEDDTVFNYGYDEDSQFFMWNVTSLDFGPDYEALAEVLGVDSDFEALLAACGLEAPEGEDEIVYSYSYEDGVIALFELGTDTPIDMTNCESLTGGYVTGPAGQVNHGMFLKLFNSMYDGPNRGCLVRHVAKSGLGKGTQQAQADPEFEAPESPEPIEDGEVTFTTVSADCQRGPGGDDAEETEGEDERGGPPQHVLDKWGGDKPGKPANTPGGRP